MEQNQTMTAPKAPNPDERVTVISPQGVKGTVSRKNLDTLINQGFTYVDPEAAAKQALQDKYDAPLKTGALAAANTLTLGASNVLLDKTGILPAEEQKKLEEANPTASTVGEIAGFVGAAPLRLSPLGLLTTAATTVGKKVGAKAGGKVVGTAAELATTGGLISAGVTAGDLTSRAALGEKLTAEQIAQEMSFNTLLGAGASTAFGGIYAGGKKALESQIAKKAVNVAVVQPIRFTAQKALNAYANVFGPIAKQNPEEIKEILKGAFTREGASVRQQLNKDFYDSSEKIQKLADTMEEVFNTGQILRQTIKSEKGLMTQERKVLLKDINKEIPYNFARDVKNTLDDNLMNMSKDKKLSTADIKKFQILADEFKTKLDTVIEKKANPAQVYNQIENIRIGLDGFKNKLKGNSGSVLEFKRYIDDIRDNISGSLKNEKLFGAAGIRTAEVDKAWSQFLTAQEAFLEKFGIANPAHKLNPLAPKKIPNPDKFNTYANVIDKIGGKNAQILTNNYISSLANLARQIEKKPDQIIKKLQQDQKYKEAYESIASKIKSSENFESLGLQKKLTDADLELVKKYRGMNEIAKQAGEVVMPATVGYIAGDILGIDPTTSAAIFGAYGFLKDPTRMMQALNAAERTVFKAQDLTKKAARAITTDRKIAGFDIQPKNMLYVPIIGSVSDSKEAKASGIPIPKKVAAIQQRQEEMSKVLNNPMDAMERVGRNLGPLAAMNEDLAMNMQVQTLKTMQYLNDKIPPGITSEDDPLRPSRIPSESEIAKYERIYEAATNPMIVLKRLEEGRLTKEEVDTVKFLYPEIYQDMVFEITNAIAENPKGLTYSKKVQLSVLFGQPFDPSMSPELLKTVQSSYNPGSQPQQSPQPQSPGRVNVAQLGRSGVVNNYMTDAQRAFMQ